MKKEGVFNFAMPSLVPEIFRFSIIENKLYKWVYFYQCTGVLIKSQS